MPLIQPETLEEDYEDKLAPDGEYDLRIQKATKKRTKADDRDMVELMVVVDGAEGDGLSPIFHYLIIPNESEEPKTRRLFMQNITRTYKVFGIDSNAEIEDLQGATGRCMVVQREDNEGIMRNSLRLPRVE